MARAESAEYRPFKSDEARNRYLNHYDKMEASWPVASEMVTVDTNYGTSFVRVTGSASASPLVLLPAGNSTSQGWYPMISALSERFRTYAVDAIYDVGKSVPSRPVKGAVDAVRWLDSLFDGLGLTDKVDLAGLSLGASVAAEYLLHSPERVRKAVWISPPAVVAPVSKGFILRAMTCILPMRSPYTAYVRWMMPDLASQQERQFNDLVDGLMLERKCYGLAPKVNPREFSDAELAGIGVPVLYVVGERDVVCEDPRLAIRHVNEVAPRIEAFLVPDAGHEAYAMKPELVSGRVLEFLEA